MTNVLVCDRPVTIPAERWTVAEFVAEVIGGMDVKAVVKERFGGPFLEGYDGRVTVSASWPGQHDVLAVLVDVSVGVESEAHLENRNRTWTHWVASTAFLHRDLARLTPARLSELVRWRVGKALSNWRQVSLGACDEVSVADEDTPPGFWDEAPPDVIVGE